MNHILLVDDETAMLQIIQKVIQWKNFDIDEVYVANNASKAREILQEHRIDITVCDIEMPQESGLDLIGWIQGMYPEIINIILTGHADFNYARNAISLGVYRFLLKPVAFDELEETIVQALELIQKKNERQERDKLTESPESMVLAVKRYLEDNYNTVITRNDIESLVHLNKDYINREFKSETGYTLMEYIQYYRIYMAKKLLKNTVPKGRISWAFPNVPASRIFCAKSTNPSPLPTRKKSMYFLRWPILLSRLSPSRRICSTERETVQFSADWNQNTSMQSKL